MVLAILLTHLAVATPAVQSGELTTVRLIARTLDRLGEKEMAKRLLRDYTQDRRVTFDDLGGDGVNAETGRGSGGKNEMTLDRSMLRIAELERILAKRPYGASSPLVSAAVTIFHEYQHMDQQNPRNTPKFEDPAWKATDEALARWADRLQTEWKAINAWPPSANRTAKLQEIGDLVKQLIGESATIKEGIQRNVTDGILSSGIPWKIDSTVKKLKALQSAKPGSGGPVPPKPAGKAWVLVEVVDFNQKPTDASYVLSYGRGSIGWRWSLGPDTFGFQSTWSEPPRVIDPGSRITLDIAVSITANTGNQYSANGNFAVWFDRPDIDPGFAGSPISFTNDRGEGGGFDVSHANAKAGSSMSRKVWVDASKLPAGRDGARIALITCAYIGRVAGTKYIYEWKQVP